MNMKRGLATRAIAALALNSLAACGSDNAQDEEKPDSLSFWYYEEDDAGQTQAWKRAAEAFEKETGVEIKFERKSFTQIAQNGSQFLNSDEAPDLMESNRGNGSAGVLSTMGLLTDLGDYVSQYGWSTTTRTSSPSTVLKSQPPTTNSWTYARNSSTPA